MQQWTLQRLLNWIAGYFVEHQVDAPRLSAEMLLSHVTGLKRIELYTNFEKTLPQDQLDKLHALVKRCGDQEPVAYLVGQTEFYSIQMKVTPDCLIPRPETELLTEKAIEFLRKRPQETEQYVCDLCTGSGCIAVAIAKNCKAVKVIATDISDAALSVAARNVTEYKLQDRIQLLCGDLFEPVIEGLDVTRFDLIVCNPPYVTSSEYHELENKVKDYEPKQALYAGRDGLDIYRRIAAIIGEHLKEDGALMLEIGFAHGNSVRKLLEKTELFSNIQIEKDFNNNDRIVLAKKLR